MTSNDKPEPCPLGLLDANGLPLTFAEAAMRSRSHSASYPLRLVLTCRGAPLAETSLLFRSSKPAEEYHFLGEYPDYKGHLWMAVYPLSTNAGKSTVRDWVLGALLATRPGLSFNQILSDLWPRIKRNAEHSLQTSIKAIAESAGILGGSEFNATLSGCIDAHFEDSRTRIAEMEKSLTAEQARLAIFRHAFGAS